MLLHIALHHNVIPLQLHSFIIQCPQKPPCGFMTQACKHHHFELCTNRKYILHNKWLFKYFLRCYKPKRFAACSNLVLINHWIDLLGTLQLKKQTQLGFTSLKHTLKHHINLSFLFSIVNIIRMKFLVRFAVNPIPCDKLILHTQYCSLHPD